MNLKIDLHIHSNLSDGTMSPFEIIDTAVKNQVETISITDHDSIAAYSPELFDYAKARQISIIPGVEISTSLNKAGFHVLGYNIDLDNPLLINSLSKLKNARHDYLKKVTKKLTKLGYLINYQQLAKIKIVTKAHIARDIINNPQNFQLLIKQFSKLPTTGKFIETIMNEGCIGYVKKVTITPMEASKLIKQAHGKVVLAHPVCYYYEDGTSRETIINLLKEMNADGLEAIYIYIDRNNQKINEIETWSQVAKKLNLFITAGSDFHQKDLLHPQIGLINEDISNDESLLPKIINDLNK